MLSIANQIGKVSIDIENAKQTLTQAFKELGLQLIKNQAKLDYVENSEILEKLNIEIKQVKILDKSINEVNQTIEKINQNDQGITSISSKLEHSKEQFKKLLEMLGANLVEIYDSGKLPEALEYCIIPYTDYQEREKSERIFNDQIKKVFYKIGKLTYYSERGDKLENFKAKAILAEMKDITNLRMEMNKQLGLHKENLHSLKKDYGVVNVSLRELKLGRDSHNLKLKELYSDYGEKIFQLNEKAWEYDEPVLLTKEITLVKKIKNQLHYYELLSKELELEHNIDISENKIAGYTDRLNYLRKQIATLEETKKKVIENIENENLQINESKKNQFLIRKEAEGLI